MPDANITEMVLGCRSWQEAQRIVDHLLDSQLINSAEFFTSQPNKADNDFQGGVKLVVQTVQHLVHDIETELSQLPGTEASKILHVSA